MVAGGRDPKKGARGGGKAEADYALAVELGLSALRDGQLDQAVSWLNNAYQLNPDAGDAQHWLGLVAFQIGKADQAALMIAEAVRLRPDWTEAVYNLALVEQARGKSAEAIRLYRRAIELNPDHSGAANNLAAALIATGRLGEGTRVIEGRLAKAPNDAGLHNNLGAALREAGRIPEAIAEFRRAVELKPDFAEAGSNLLYARQCDGSISAFDLSEAHRDWGRRFAQPMAPARPSWKCRPDPAKRLRIGYVSPDFRAHSVACFLEPLLANHDHRAVEVICYADIHQLDEVGRRLKSHADLWREIPRLDDAALAGVIHEDAVDVLIDLAGHTNGHRLLAFARRPAPVQATWLGYPGTTGVEAIGWRFTDAEADPEGLADLTSVELLHRLPGGFLCFNPPDRAPDLAPPPAPRAGFVTFGSFNNLAKVTEGQIKLWSRLLARLPGSRLLLKSSQLADAETERRCRDAFAAQGIAADRLTTLAFVPDRAGHLAVYGQVDIALDCFPYNGTTTTCEALWMGVPVISRAGDRHAARVGASILTRAGLADLIVDDDDALIEAAARLAADGDRLALLRRTLRRQVQQSSLADGPGFARGMESACRHLFGLWCNEQGAAG